LGLLLASCVAPDTQHHIVVSTREQKLAVLDRGTLMATYPVSTSKFGLGDYLRSSRTPWANWRSHKRSAIMRRLPPCSRIGSAQARLWCRILPVAIPLSRAFFGCEDAKRKTLMRLAGTSTFTGHRKNGLSGCLRAMDVSGCARVTSFNCTTS